MRQNGLLGFLAVLHTSLKVKTLRRLKQRAQKRSSINQGEQNIPKIMSSGASILGHSHSEANSSAAFREKTILKYLRLLLNLVCIHCHEDD